MLQAGDPVAVRESRAGADVRVPGGAGGAGAVAAAEDLRRARAGAAAVRHPAHRRPRLARQHALQGRLSRQPPRGAVVLEGEWHARAEMFGRSYITNMCIYSFER